MHCALKIITVLCLSIAIPATFADSVLAAPGEVVITHASMSTTAIPLWVTQQQGFFTKYGVKAVINKGGMSEQMYQDVFQKHGVVCLSTMPYGIGAIYGKEVVGVADVIWKEQLGMSEAMWLLQVKDLGPLLVEGDTHGNSYASVHAADVNAPLAAIYRDLPEPILKRFGEVTDRTQELIG